MRVWFWRRVTGLAMIAGGVSLIFGHHTGWTLAAAKRVARAKAAREQS